METPASASDISLDWMRSVLSRDDPGCEPISADVEPGFGGWSLLGRIARVRLAYAGPRRGPSTVIVKFQRRDLDREPHIYRLLMEAGLRCVPRLIGAFERGTLVLEDLSPARPGSQVTGCTVRQAEDVLGILAEIHGRFWEDPRVPPEPPEKFAGTIRFNMEQCWGPFTCAYGGMLGGATAGFEWVERHAETVAAHRLRAPATLFHGDVHAENLLFRLKGGPILLDWQLALRGLAANDVSFFLVKSLNVAERRANEQRLLRDYHDLLPKAARVAYGFDRLLLDYRACVSRSMVSAVMLAGPRFADRPDRTALADALAERVAAAVRDLDPVGAFRELGRR